jgi:hypothetical protein
MIAYHVTFQTVEERELQIQDREYDHIAPDIARCAGFVFMEPLGRAEFEIWVAALGFGVGYFLG